MIEENELKYHSCVLFVSDVEKSKNFYKDLLGQRIESDFGRFIGFIGGFGIWEKTFAHEMMGLKEDECSISCKEVELYFEINDIESLYTTLKNEKITFVHDIIESPWHQRSFRIYDPDNHIIEISEPMNVVIERLYDEGISHNQIIKQTQMPKNIVLDVIERIDSVKTDKHTSELIAPCGMNCRICLGYFGYLASGKKRKMRCIGCKPRDKSCAFLKKYCKKLTKNEVEYCYECSDFPCSHLEKLDKGYRERYHMSMIENLEFIRDNGMDAFLKQQEKKYTCPTCGGVMCVHTDVCYSCKK